MSETLEPGLSIQHAQQCHIYKAAAEPDQWCKVKGLIESDSSALNVLMCYFSCKWLIKNKRIMLTTLKIICIFCIADYNVTHHNI